MLRRGDALLVVFLAVGVHIGALGLLRPVELTFDDEAIIAGNPRLIIRGEDDLRRLVTGKYWGERFDAERLWRPLPLLSFALDRTILGPQPHRYRWTSTALHALAAWLVLLLFQQLLPRRIALAGALLFAAHPVHAEATAGVVGRAEVLALLGNLGGVLMHLRGRRAVHWWARPLWFIAAGVSFFLGFLGKEIALTGPVVLIVVEIALRRPREHRIGPWLRRFLLLLPYLYYAVVIGLYGWARHEVLGSLVAEEGAKTLGAMPFGQRVLVAGHSALDGWLSMVIPHTTSGHYPFTPPTLNSGIPVIGIHAIFVIGALVLLARRHWLARALGLGVLATYMSMGPVLNLVPIGVIRADRLLYTPSLYGCLTVVAGLAALVALVTHQRRERRTEVGVWVFAACLVVYAWIHAGNVRAWTDNEILWRTSVQRYPDEPRPKLYLGNRLVNKASQGDPRGGRDPAALRAEAQALLHAAAKGFQPGRPGWPKQAAQARAGLGNVLLKEHPETARELYIQAQQIDSACEMAALGLVQYHLDLADKERNPALKQREINYAEKQARAAANRVAPHSYDAWLLWGTTLSRLQRRDADALAAYTQAIALHTAPWQAHFNRAHLRRLGPKDMKGALADYRRVVAILLRKPPAQLQGDPELGRFLPDALLYQAALALALGEPDAQALLDMSRRVFEKVYPKAPQRELLEGIAKEANR